MSEQESMPPVRPQLDWIARWQLVARRIRVPLGFATAGLYLFELWRRAPEPDRRRLRRRRGRRGRSTR